MALAYKAQLEQLAPKVTFYMSLYLNPDLTPDEIRKAAKAGVRGNVLPLKEIASGSALIKKPR